MEVNRHLDLNRRLSVVSIQGRTAKSGLRCSLICLAKCASRTDGVYYDNIVVVLFWRTLCDPPPDFIIEGAVFKKVLYTVDVLKKSSAPVGMSIGLCRFPVAQVPGQSFP